jgi:hypothetical protein
MGSLLVIGGDGMTMRQALRSVLLAVSAAVLSSSAAVAQVSDSNVRAMNLARNWAVNTNGGLSVYGPAACMFNTGEGGGSCLLQGPGEAYTFRFFGGAPGWEVQGRPPTTETQMQITPDGRTVQQVEYNGPPR